MTINEAIALVKIERECVIRADVCDRKCEKCDLLQDSAELIDMYEHLAEWLEELKCYKNYNDFSDYADRLHKIAFNIGYNKAIDDFAEKLKSECREHYIDCEPYFGCIADNILYEEDIDEIAEQLKAGGENDD